MARLGRPSARETRATVSFSAFILFFVGFPIRVSHCLGSAYPVLGYACACNFYACVLFFSFFLFKLYLLLFLFLLSLKNRNAKTSVIIFTKGVHTILKIFILYRQYSSYVVYSEKRFKYYLQNASSIFKNYLNCT